MSGRRTRRLQRLEALARRRREVQAEAEQSRAAWERLFRSAGWGGDRFPERGPGGKRWSQVTLVDIVASADEGADGPIG